MIETHLSGDIYQIQMNRPRSRNALNKDMRAELAQAFKSIPSGTRLVYLCGTKEAFCSGQDLSEFDEETDIQAVMEDEYRPILDAIENLEVPIVAGVEGACAGAGVSLALACDIVLASEESFFQVAFGKIGLVPDILITYHLPRLVGHARAMGMALTGERISAKQALDYGMIWQVFPAEDFDQQSKSFCENLANGASLALGMTRKALRQSWQNDMKAQFALEAKYQAVAGESQDFFEGVLAFQQKRAPKFRGR